LNEESANHRSLDLDISAQINKNLIEKAKHDLELDLNHLRDLEVKIDDLISPKSDPIKENENVFIADEQHKLEDLIETSQQQEPTQHDLHAEIEKNLNELTIEIDIKKRLIDELETNQKKLEQMRVHYEDKVNVLQERIKQIQTERDKLVTNMSTLIFLIK
jgi:predicted  nucleic acid-binding Zn-ribbon protein